MTARNSVTDSARFICCNNAPDAGVAEALAENNRLPVTNDMANQSCFITAIAFLKFEFFRHLYSGLLGLRLLKLKLFRVESALQFVILQHCINATTLLLYHAAVDHCLRSLQKVLQATGLALPIIGSVLNTGVSGCWDVSDCPLLVLDANDNCKRYACCYAHLGKLCRPRTYFLPEWHFLPLMRRRLGFRDHVAG